MPGTDVRSRDEAHDGGLSPTTWAIMLTFVAIGIGYLLGEQTWITPDWHRWWLPILVLEVFVYSLTLIIPPTGRLTVRHGILRVAVGMGMRLVVVLVNAVMRLSGGDSSFPEGVQVYWAAHWPAAIGEIACVAVAVYWFRYLSVQRVLRARAAKHDAVPAVLDPTKRPREELVDELTSGGWGGPRESAVAVEAPPPWLEPESAPTAPEPAAVEAYAEPAPPVAEPEAAPTVGPGITVIKLPAEVVLRSLPETMLTEPVDALAPPLAATEVSFPWEAIAPQLATGEVRMDALAVLMQLPRTVLAGPANRFADQLPEGVLLPLEEIVMRVPLEIFAPPLDQEPGTDLPGGPPIFRETGSPPAVPSTAYVAPPPAPTAPPPVVEPVAPVAPQPVPELVASEEPASTAVEEPTPEPLEEEAPAAVAAETLEPEPEEPLEQPVAAEPDAADEEDEEEEEARRERALAAAISALQRPVPAEPAEEDEPEAATLDEPEVVVEEELEPEAVAALTGRDEESAPVVEPSVAGTLFALPVDERPAEEPEPVAATVEPSEEPAPADEAPMEEPAPEPEIHEPAPVAAEAPSLEPDVEQAILGALKGAGALRLELVSRDGLTVVVADGSERVDGAFDLTKSVLALASASGGHLSFALVMGARGATFVGGTDQAPGAYLAVTSEGASAGQVSVAARKALGSLERLSAGVPYAASTPPVAAEDLSLAAIAGGAAGNAPSGFCAASGTGVMVFGFDSSAAGVVASAAAEAWQAAKAAQTWGADKVLLITSNRTVGVALSGEASALVVGAFEPGVNLGLASSSLTKLVKACDQAAGRGGL